jgi:hypothetical protein
MDVFMDIPGQELNMLKPPVTTDVDEEDDAWLRIGAEATGAATEELDNNMSKDIPVDRSGKNESPMSSINVSNC